MPVLAETIAVAMEQAARGRVPQAIEDLRRQLPVHPNSAELHQALGLLVMRTGQLDQGLFHFERAATVAPGRAEYISNYATALNMKGRVKEAAEQFRKAVQLSPRFFPANLGLSSALIAVHDYAGAVDAGRSALSLAPGRPEAAANLALALLRCGRSAEALGVCNEAVAQVRDHPLLLTLLANTLNHRPEADPAQVAEEHKRLGKLIHQLTPAMYPDFADLTPERPLRVGYLSHQLTDGNLAAFIAPLLAGHSPDFEAFCYSAVQSPDATTKRLQRQARHWSDISRMPDEQLEHRIRTDRIDILVELDGHLPGARIAALARRLAPVQITYLGYPNTTGLKEVDYRLTDAISDPEGAEQLGTEKPLRLSTLACWQPPESAPGVAPRAGRDAPVTFAAFGAAERINERVVELWGRILAAAPGSRLMLRADAFSGAAVRSDYAAQFKKHGVGEDRLEFLGQAGESERLAALARADIALDTFPVSGAAGICEALWMGLPVITLRGTTQGARRGASLLAAAGLQEFIADSAEDYIAQAGRLDANRARLADLRGSLREHVRTSSLCAPGAFLESLEAAYREAWKTRVG